MEDKNNIGFIIVDDSKYKRNDLAYTLKRIEGNYEVIDFWSKEVDSGDGSYEKELFDYLHNKENPIPNVILMDLKFNEDERKGIEITKMLIENFGNKENKTCKFKIYIYSSMHLYNNDPQKIQENNNLIKDAIEAGASGFIEKAQPGGIEALINSLNNEEKYFFTEGIKNTIIAAFYQNAKGVSPIKDKEKLFNELNLEYKVYRKLLKLMAEGHADKDIAKKMDWMAAKEPDDGKVRNEKSNNLSPKLQVANNATAIVVKALKLGLIDTEEINPITEKNKTR